MKLPVRFTAKRILAGVALAALAAAVLAWFQDPGRDFDPVLWRDDAMKRQGVRLGMADRLAARGSLMHKTRAEVVAMLGEPPPTEYFKGNDLVYWLGPERSYFGIDSEWLAIRLGKDGRVAECRIVRD
jgi:hypothetical protein